MSLVASPEAPLIKVDTSDVVVPREFGGGMYDLSLLHMYMDHVARNMWNEEVKFICIYSFKHMRYIIRTF